ncbi:hypothetical protein, partial [Paraburkholderia caribensis]|uniref:hypothetical protein n=1 Tax=Paraburkholderia caribensis TaxID=75105 RepID=UPI001ABA9F4C
FVRLVAIEKLQRPMRPVSLFLVAARFDTVWADHCLMGNARQAHSHVQTMRRRAQLGASSLRRFGMRVVELRPLEPI